MIRFKSPNRHVVFFLQPCNTTLLHGNKVWLLPFQFQGCNACLVTRLVLPCYKAGKQAYYQVVIFIWRVRVRGEGGREIGRVREGEREREGVNFSQ